MTVINQGLTIAATRGAQGGRTMYQALVPNNVLNSFFTVNMDPPEERSQRQLDPKHANGIRDYILDNADGYVLGALIYGVDQECRFTPSELHPDLGALTIPFGASLRSLDGQHRRQGLNEAIAEDSQYGQDHTAVLIYVEPDVSSRRQIFSDLNSTPRKVSKAINVAFDHRDPFARVAQSAAKDHPVIGGKIEMEKASVPSTSESWYTLGAFHDALKRLFVGPAGRVKKPSMYAESDIQEAAEHFLAAVSQISDIRDVIEGRSSIGEARSRSIVFSSTTLRVIANAYYLFSKEHGDSDWDAFTAQLLSIDFSTSNTDWYETGFLNKGRATPNARQQEVTRASRYIAGTV